MRYLSIILSIILINLGSEASANFSNIKINHQSIQSATVDVDSLDFVIPVVIFYSSDTNVSPSEIGSTLDKINNIFNNAGLCDDINIPLSSTFQFCLASRDIDKNSSEGIISLGSQFASFDSCEDEFNLKFSPRMMSDPYPTSDYINIYLVDEICASCENFGCAAGGYSTLPSSHGSIMDGIILEMDTWLGDCDDAKTIIHEFGHYFGLYHTFEGGCKNDNCLEDGDKVCDTPPQHLELITSDHICLQGSSNNSCNSDVNLSDPNNMFTTDQDDPDDNIMNYIPLACQESLTPGQVERMQSILCNDRASLLHSDGCTEPCAQKIDILLNIPEAAFVNQPFEIENNSGDSNSYLWEVDGQQLNTLDLSYTFINLGIFTITLYASNSEMGCNEEYTFTINVTCFEQPIIVTDNTLISEIDTINLSIENFDPLIEYTWYAGDSIIGMGSEIDYYSNYFGSNSIYVLACMDSCCNESNLLHILGGSCPPNNEGDLWIFGTGGVVMDFSSWNPIELPNVSDGNIATSFFAPEACTIQLDSMGEVLFYSNNDKIWDKNNSLIANGNTIGSASSSQTLSLRKPGSKDIYYIFTPQEAQTYSFPLDAAEKDSLQTTYFSIINMSMNGGLGEVISKDNKLMDFGSEKISAIRHCNGVDWWVVVHQSGNNEFFSFLLNDNGLDLNPIISKIGGIHPFQNGKHGFIKFSHDGKLLATTFNRNRESSVNVRGSLELFNFDNSTGQLYNMIMADTTFHSPYGIEFSPDNSKLYISDQRIIFLNQNRLVQYDLDILEQTSILNSKHSYNLPNSDFRSGALQLGKDGKIYNANNSTPFNDSPHKLHVINSPNLKGGQANFQLESFNINNGPFFVGLPNFPARVYRQEYPEIEGPDSINICIDSIVTYYSFGRCSVEDYTWELIGENTLLQTTGDTVQVAFHTKSIDTLLLTRTTACGEYTDRLPIIIDDCNFVCDLAFDWIEVDTLICEGESPTLHYSHNSNELYVNNILQNKNNTRIDLGPIINDTCLTLQLLDNYECDSTFQVCITVGEPLSFAFEDEVAVCEGNVALIDVTSDADIIELINLENDSVLTVNAGMLFTEPIFEPTSYLLRLARYDGNCDSYFPLLAIPDTMVYEEVVDTLFCFGDSLIVNDSLITLEGSYEFELTTTKGCDSLLILNAQYYILPESDTSYVFVCTLEEVDTLYIQDVSADGCVYEDVQIFTLVDLDTTLVQGFSCDSQSLQNDTISLINIQGCDSIVIIEYEYEFDSTKYYEVLDTTICPEGEIFVGDSLLTEFGTYVINTTSLDGCDSIVAVTIDTFQLPVQDTIFTYTCLISQVDTTYEEQVTPNGCAYNDVLITIHESLDTSFASNIVCNENLDLFDTLHLFSIDGCDSIVIIENEYVFDSTLYLQNIDTLICPDQEFTFSDSIITQEGSYDFIFTAQDGCDSIVALNVSYFLLPDIDTSYTITCNSSEIDTIEVFDTTPEGCIYFDINIITYSPPDTSFTSESICNASNEFNDTLVLFDINGCDSLSIISYIFSFDSSRYYQEIDTLLCPEQELSIGDSTISSSGHYEFELQSVDGCDSILSINLEYYDIPNNDTIYNYTCNELEADTTSTTGISENGCPYPETIITNFVPADTTFLVEVNCIDTITTDTMFLLNEFNCDSIVITEYIFENIDVYIEINNPYQANQTVDLFIENVDESFDYAWYLDSVLVCENCTSYSFSTSVDQELSIIATNEFGCTSSFNSLIEIEKTTKVTFANVFSPNGDQVNDRFIPIGYLDENLLIRNFKIYDRWGNLVHFEETLDINDESFGWDGNFNGRPCQEGVYVYQLTLSSNSSDDQIIFGDVALIR